MTEDHLIEGEEGTAVVEAGGEEAILMLCFRRQ